MNPDRLLKSVGVISLLSAYQIFVFSDSRGRLSLQGEIKLPYEKSAFRRVFLCRKLNKKTKCNLHLVFVFILLMLCSLFLCTGLRKLPIPIFCQFLVLKSVF